MENIPRMFNYDQARIRVVVKQGEPWWVAKDVCDVLELGNSRQAVSRLDDDEKNTVTLNDGTPGNPNKAIVNEPGLYTLILASRKPEARAFKRWITHEVIPSIRKTGRYSAEPQPIDKSKQMRAEAMLKNAKVREAKALEDLATKFRDILNPAAVHSLVAYAANAVTGKQILALPEIEKTYTATEIAEELGVSANKVGRVANQHGLKTDAFGVQVLDKSPYSSKQVPSFRYNEAGRQALKDLLGDLV